MYDSSKKISKVSQTLVYLTKWTKKHNFFGCLNGSFLTYKFSKKTFQSLPKEMEINTKLDYSNFQLLDQPEFQNVTDRSVMMRCLSSTSSASNATVL